MYKIQLMLVCPYLRSKLHLFYEIIVFIAHFFNTKMLKYIKISFFGVKNADYLVKVEFLSRKNTITRNCTAGVCPCAASCIFLLYCGCTGAIRMRFPFRLLPLCPQRCRRVCRLSSQARVPIWSICRLLATIVRLPDSGLRCRASSRWQP